MRKIGITSTGQGIDSIASPGFGRSPYICIVEWDNGQITGYKAIASPGTAGSGIIVAQDIAKEGIESVVTGFIGFNAYNELKSKNIEVYMLNAANKVEDVAKEYFAGNLPPANAPNFPGGGLGGGRGNGKGRGQGRGQGSGQGTGRGRNNQP